MLLTLHCEESTQLMSAGLERDLTVIERWAVRLHAVICASCRRFRRQLRFLQDAARRRAAAPLPGPMPPALRERILRDLANPPRGKDSP